MAQYIGPLIMHDHANKKTQTHETFERLCAEILKRGFTSMAELVVIPLKSLKACKVLRAMHCESLMH